MLKTKNKKKTAIKKTWALTCGVLTGSIILGICFIPELKDEKEYQDLRADVLAEPLSLSEDELLTTKIASTDSLMTNSVLLDESDLSESQNDSIPAPGVPEEEEYNRDEEPEVINPIITEAQQSVNSKQSKTPKTGNSKNNKSVASNEDVGNGGVKWNKLQSMNPDIIGWIQMDPNVNYPILRSAETGFYINHNSSGKKSGNGSIYVNPSASIGLNDKNTIIYGHNLNSGAMFGSLKKYKNAKYAANHQDIVIYTPTDTYTYKIFNVAITDDGSSAYRTIFSNDAEFAQYINECRSLSDIHPYSDIDYSKNMITLSTCSSKRRLIIQAIRIN